MGRTHKQMMKARQAGLSNVDLLRIKQKAKQNYNEQMQEVFDKTMLLHLYVTCDILGNEYWEKSAKKKIPEFVNKYLTLLQTIERDHVDYAEIIDSVKESCGIDLQAAWMDNLKKEENDK